MEMPNMLQAQELDELEAAPADSDGRLLERFILDQDEFAFEEIVRRHGLMVLGVCQRVLDNRHDAEDCFQAVFMVLVRKATTIQPTEMVGNWLYGVAYRTALEARKLAARRRNLEKKKFAMPQPESAADLWTEMRPLLDKELSRLPDKYRFVLVACDLEGKTRKVVADQLGLPEGTIASRLARGRVLLAKRLQRYSLIVSPGFLATLLTQRGSAIRLPETLVARATASLRQGAPSNAAVLADAVVQGMLWGKIVKAATALACAVGVFGLGVAAILPTAQAELKPDAGKMALEKKKEKPRMFRDCVLKTVKPDKIEAVEFDAEGFATVHHLRVEGGTKIVIADKEDAKPADLKFGMIVHLLIERGADGQYHALRIDADGQAVSGLVQAIKDGTLTLKNDQAAEGVVQENTYELDADPKVIIKGKAAKLAEVAPGMRVTLQMSAPPERPRIVAIVGKP
jgi:RNA polymerase sigma factor (sigma-70 family)